jgi:hypothetical protein
MVIPPGHVEGDVVVDEVPADQVAQDTAAERVGEAIKLCLVDAGGLVELGLAVLGGGKEAVGDEAVKVEMTTQLGMV